MSLQRVPLIGIFFLLSLFIPSVCSEQQQGEGSGRNPLVAIRKQCGKWVVISEEGEDLGQELIKGL